jgi:hypothetical protein
MAQLIYGAGVSYEFDERTLAHLKIVIASKLRQREPFLLNWQIPTEQGSGSRTLWFAPDIPIAFRFRDQKPPQLNRVWLEALTRSAYEPAGMTVIPEAAAEEYLRAAGPAAAP